MSGVEAKLVYEKYDEMIGLLRSYRESIYQQWVGGVDQDCHFNLGQPLIQRDPFSGLIQVNFSKAVGPWQAWGWGRHGREREGRPPGGSPCHRPTPATITEGEHLWRCLLGARCRHPQLW